MFGGRRETRASLSITGAHTSQPRSEPRGPRCKNTASSRKLSTLRQQLASCTAAFSKRPRVRQVQTRVAETSQTGSPGKTARGIRWLQGARIWAILGTETENQLWPDCWRKFEGQVGDFNPTQCRASRGCVEILSCFLRKEHLKWADGCWEGG